EQLERIIERRVRARLGDFDPTGLPPIFPFSEENLRQLEGQPTVRACLRRLSEWFNEAVFGPPSLPVEEKDKTLSQTSPLLAILDARWHAEVSSARKLLEGDVPRPSLIPEVQTALERWLAYLREQRLGCAAKWAKVELLQEMAFGPYGYLTVIRPDGPD